MSSEKSKRNVIIRHSWSLDLQDEENGNHECKQQQQKEERESKNKLLNVIKKRSLKLFHSLDEDLSANRGKIA